MNRRHLLIPVVVFVAWHSIQCTADEPTTRKIEFTYRGTIEDVKDGSRVRVWIPIAQSDEHQDVEIIEEDFPGEVQRASEPKYGNEMFYFDAVGSGADISFAVKYRVTRREITSGRPVVPAQHLDEDQRKLFLSPNSLVPVSGRPVELFEQFLQQQAASTASSTGDDPLARGQQFYQWVWEHMTYDKSKPGYGNGDVAWACDSQTGNCTDFHSLFISVARNRKIPAKFEIGFPLPVERGSGTIGGYHCWAKFFVDKKGWIPVDISEADKHPELAEYYFGNLTENRIHFTTGRDITLRPRQSGQPLNYFIYPHVEIDGEIATDQVKREFRFADIEQ